MWRAKKGMSVVKDGDGGTAEVGVGGEEGGVEEI